MLGRSIPGWPGFLLLADGRLYNARTGTARAARLARGHGAPVHHARGTSATLARLRERVEGVEDVEIAVAAPEADE